MKRIIRHALTLVLSLGILLGLSMPAHAACYYPPPRTGSHVTYYNCQGPYYVSYSRPYYRYYCYADWDWYAEFWWGKYDGPVWVWAVETCYT